MNALTIPFSANIESFDLYQRQVQAIPILTEEEELELAQKLKRDNDLEAARKLIVSHLRLVIKIARSFSGYGLNQADLVQEGNIGLMKAVKRFDPDRGVRLVSFAVLWIKAEIQEFVIKNWRLVKTATTKAQRKLFFNLRSMRKTLNPLKQAEIKEISNKLNVKEADVMEMEYRLNGHDLPIDYSDSDEEDSFRPISYLEDEGADPFKIISSDESENNQLTHLSSSISRLDERSQYILKARWLDPENTKTLHELAAELNVSAERVRQIEQNALQKLKQLMKK
jgi:RNA polymerase sigma-32 factor